MPSAVPISVPGNDSFLSHHQGGGQSLKGNSFQSPGSLSKFLTMSGSSFDFSTLNNLSKLGTSAESDRARSFKAFLAEEMPMAKSDDFCRDFTCCGLVLSDLHSLLQHYEDVHVVVMPEESPSNTPQTKPAGMAGAFDPEAMELDSGPSPTMNSQQGSMTPAVPSAFDTSVLRSSRGASFPTVQTGSRTTSPTRSGTSTPMSQRFPYALESPSSPASAVTPSMLSAPTTPLSSRPSSPAMSDSTTTVSRPGSSLTRNKPFKCPTPGCNKQYLQANGLKYHRLHGQCNFASKDPSLEGLSEQEAEERLRPYACAVGGNCERRYKNMNGLRYHYQHSGAHGAIGLALLSSGAHSPLPGKSGLSHQKKRSPEAQAQQHQLEHMQAQQQASVMQYPHSQQTMQQAQMQQQQQMYYQQNPYHGYAVPMDINMGD